MVDMAGSVAALAIVSGAGRFQRRSGGLGHQSTAIEFGGSPNLLIRQQRYRGAVGARSFQVDRNWLGILAKKHSAIFSPHDFVQFGGPLEFGSLAQ